MSNYTTTDRADLDLIEIYTDGIELFGRLQALRYIRELKAIFERLAAFPHMGRAAGSFGPSVRRHEHGSHIILYREAPDGVTILAVVPSRSMRRLRL